MSAAFDPTAVKACLNQYWYSQKTIQGLLSEVLHHATHCAFLSSPSLFFALDQLRGDEEEAEVQRIQTLRKNSKLFEFDQQWASDPGFVAYNYELEPSTQFPIHYAGAFDYIVADPPFITEDVWESYILAIRFLLKPGGKVLLTTVLENHTMLEELLDGPLFIPLFRPLVMSLTYQYVCFLNYEATRLCRVNDEVEAEDPKIRSAIEMANNIRQSETEFTLQMQQRKRDGETALSRRAYEREKEEQLKGKKDGAAAAAVEAKDLSNVPLSEMPWGHVPEGLAAQEQPPPPVDGEEAAAAALAAAVAKDPEYTTLMALRTHLDALKGTVDGTQKVLEKLLQLQGSHQKKMKAFLAADEKGNTVEEAEEEFKKAFAELQELRLAKLEEMMSLLTTVRKEEEVCAAFEGSQLAPPLYLNAIPECVEAYKSVAIRKQALLELASSATGKYKSPIFIRMKAVLQEIKRVKAKIAAGTA